MLSSQDLYNDPSEEWQGSREQEASSSADISFHPDQDQPYDYSSGRDSGSPDIKQVGPLGEHANQATVLCSICSENISHQHQHIHYGAVACFSCRAFFRRAQRLKRPFSICKQNGGCLLTVANRRFCGSCRFAACIQAGMNPKSVLSEEEKQHRFRRILKRKSEEHLYKLAEQKEKRLKSRAEVTILEKYILDLYKEQSSRPKLNANILQLLFNQIKDQTEEIAMQIPSFTKSGYVKRRLMLIENAAPIFALRMCQFFTAETANDQVWSLFPHLRHKVGVSNSKSKPIVLSNVIKASKSLISDDPNHESLLMNHFFSKFANLTSLCKNEKESLRLNTILSSLISQRLRQHETEDTLADIEKIVYRRVNDLAVLGKIIHIFYFQPPTHRIDDQDFWSNLANYTRKVVRNAINHFTVNVDDLHRVCQLKNKFVMAILMLRLHHAPSFDDQQKVISEGGHCCQDRDEKMQMFRLTTNKYLLQKALKDFEEVNAKFARCISSPLEDNDEVFKFFVLLAIFWRSEQTENVQEFGFCKAQLLTCFSEFCQSSQENLGHSVFENVRICLDDLEKIYSFSHIFASNNCFHLL